MGWLHKLLHPHCEECLREHIEERVCSSCETLKTQLAIANHEKAQMLETIISFSKPAVVVPQEPIKLENPAPKAISWAIRKQMLEANDRAEAQLMEAKRKEQVEIDKLERELGLVEGGANGRTNELRTEGNSSSPKAGVA